MLLRLISIILVNASTVYAGYTADEGLAQTPIQHSFDAIRGWMQDDFKVSGDQNPSSDYAHVCIVLRHHGELLGYGTANTLAVATTMALRDLRKHAAFRMPLDEDIKREIIDSISIELELGDAPIPSPHKNIDRFAYTFNQGTDGIAVRRGEEWNVRMQAELRLSPYRTVSNVVESLCINLGVHPTVVLTHELPLHDDVTMYSIPTTSFLQEHRGAEIITLFRGDELVTESSVDVSHFMTLADSIAEHLIKSTGENGKVIGGYQPETNTLTNMFATHFVQILSAVALEKYAVLSHSESAIQASTVILESVAHDVHRTGTIDDESASLVIAMLLNDNKKYSGQVQSMLQVCEDRVRSACKRVSTSEITKERPFILSLIANAAIKMGEKYEDAQLTGWGMDICTKCFQNVPIESRMSIIPWIVVPATVHRTNKQFERSIHELLRIVLASQVRSGDHPDLIGGFTLMARGESVVDARGLRMLPFLANLCQSSGEMNAETFLAMMQALRFTEQLTTSEHRSLRFDNPAMSLGGVRTSAWDAAMPTEATAMALLGVTEAVNTIKNIQPSTE